MLLTTPIYTCFDHFIEMNNESISSWFARVLVVVVVYEVFSVVVKQLGKCLRKKGVKKFLVFLL